LEGNGSGKIRNIRLERGRKGQVSVLGAGGKAHCTALHCMGRRLCMAQVVVRAVCLCTTRNRRLLRAENANSAKSTHSYQ